jgi:hypothetical protein
MDLENTLNDRAEGKLMENKDSNQNTGLLKNGNPRGNPNSSPRCGAKNRQGKPCQAPAMRGKKRCRLHGGKSTGPKTTEGLERSRTSRLRHGLYSKNFEKEKKDLQALTKFSGIMSSSQIDNPIVLQAFMQLLEQNTAPDFFENIDIDNLNIEDAIKVYGTAVALLKKGLKAYGKLGVKVVKKE